VVVDVVSEEDLRLQLQVPRQSKSDLPGRSRFALTP
jgi:hypothetical protein